MQRLKQRLMGSKQAATDGTAEPSEEEEKKAEIESAKGERRMKVLLERVIQKYYEHKLVGEVEISSSAFMIETSLSCEIDGSSGDAPEGLLDEEADEDEAADNNGEGGCNTSDSTDKDDTKPASKVASEPPRPPAAVPIRAPIGVKAILTGLDGLLMKLERRAQNYRGEHYKEGLSLAGSISLSDPTGYFGLCLECSATVPSLLLSSDVRKAKREEKKVAAATKKK